MTPAWLDLLAAQQDYLWFLVFMAWTGVGALLIWRPQTRPFWIVMAAISGVTVSVIEIAWLISPPKDFSHPRLGWEWALLIAGALGPAGVAWSGLPRMARRRIVWAAALGVLAAVVVWQQRVPVWGGWALVGFNGLALAGVAWKLPPGSKLFRGSLLLFVLLPALSSYGPLAAQSGEIRRWTELSHFGIAAAFLQIFIAGILGAGLWRGSGEAVQFFRNREMRWLAAAAGVWLACGIPLASWSSLDARKIYEQALLARAKAGSALIDVQSVRKLLGPDFRLGSREVVPKPNGKESISHTVTSFQGNPIRESLRLQLAQIERANPGIRWAHLVTLRKGLLLSFAFSSRVPGVDQVVPELRVSRPEDLKAWSEKSHFVEAPIISAWGELARVQVPLVDDQKRMLGWLALDFGVSDWLAVQARARFQSFATVGLGMMLALFFGLQRLRTLEREAALRSAHEAASADRAKTAFLAKVSHELRTPIQSILGYSELLRTTSLPQPQRAWLEALHTHGDLMVRLVNDLIDLSALQAGSFRFLPLPGDLAALVRDTVESLRPRAVAKGLELECIISPGIPARLQFDAQRLRQVLLNLLGNALKFTSRGRVGVTLNALPSDARGLVACELVVQDTGPGIAPEDQLKLFQPFSRINPQPDIEGAGLGLTLSAGLCQSMGGSLTLASDGRSGSTFTARWPLPAAAGLDEAVQAQPVVGNLHGRRVLVADDNTLVRDLFITHLRTQGAHVAGVANGLEAIARCSGPGYDTLVLDLSMPGAGGLEVARRLRANGRSLRIVGVSAQADAVERTRALAAGMDVFLTKPVALAALTRAISDHTEMAASPVRLEAELRARLWAQFWREQPEQLAGLKAAADYGDWAGLGARTHYLKNSADVLGWDELRGRLLVLEQQAASGAVADVNASLAALHVLFTEARPEA